MQLFWLITISLFANPGSFASSGYAQPDAPHYLRLRLKADLPLRMSNSLRHQLSLCNQANECLPLYQADSDLTQAGELNSFRQVEYFSLTRARAAAIQLGASASAAFPEELEKFSLKIDSALPGPKVIHAFGTIPRFFNPESASSLRHQSSTAAVSWKMNVPFSQGNKEIFLQAEVSVLRVAGKDITAEFKNSAADPALLFSKLKNYQVAFVTGSDGYKAKFFGAEYFDSFQRWLSENGVQNARLIPGSNRPLAEQAEAFRKFFETQAREKQKPVILVGYSIANSNFMEFLLQHGQGIKERKLLAGWISINASFLGNPLLEDTYNDLLKHDLALAISSAQGLEDIRYLSRDAYLDKNYEKILEAAKLFPVITVSSRINSASLVSGRSERHRELYARGLENDGSTGTFSHFIPGADFVRFEGTDHELLNKGTNGYGADPYSIYLKLFQRILEHPENGGSL